MNAAKPPDADRQVGLVRRCDRRIAERPRRRKSGAAWHVRWILAVVPLCIFPFPAMGTASEGPVDGREALEVLEQNCFECHGATKRKGGLRLTNRAEALMPGDSGLAVIEPGSSSVSLLIDMLEEKDVEERMPKDREPLAADQIEILRRWIDAGAPWPAAGEAARHWAYVAPARPPLPEVKQQDWARNEIDHFVLARLEAAGLHPAPEADRPLLIRRLSLDVTGLPPSPDRVEAFVNDPSPRAYEALVDRLLDEWAFGERWAQGWLDLARYADSNGFKNDRLRSSWAYRDWVIQAINDDLPFDRFTVEQLAGDLLPDPTRDQLIATGFHRNAPLSLEAGVNFEEARVDQVLDRVNTTATVWMGSTIACAQCHNHKYDPFSQEEYYRLFAFFNNTPMEAERHDKTPFVRFGGPILPVEEDVALPEMQRRLHSQSMQHNSQLAASFKKAGDMVAKLDPAQLEIQWTPVWLENAPETNDSVLVLPPDKGSISTLRIRARTGLQAPTAIRIELESDALAEGMLETTRADDPPGVELAVIAAGPEGAAPVRLRVAQKAWLRGARRWSADVEERSVRLSLARPLAGKEAGASLDLLLPEPLGDGRPTSGDFELSLKRIDSAQQSLRLRVWATQAAPILIGMDELTASLLRMPDREPAQDKRLRFRLGRRLQDPQLEASIARTSVKKRELAKSGAFVMQELDEPRTSHVFRRGNYLDPLGRVEPGTPAVLPPMDAALPRNRYGLARWLVAPENPLTARVAVNRWWAQLFGRGLVASVEDFGIQADPPTHPQLLDWLAVELREKGWSRKEVLRKILTSATYRQSARPSFSPGLELDARNTLLWQNPRLRLPAETIRDQALSAAGLLTLDAKGPPIYPPQPEGLWNHSGGVTEPKYLIDADADRFRRGVYVIWRRVAPYPSFVVFDAPDRTECVVARSRTNTPLQALALLNSPEFLEAALGLATRVLTAEPGSTAAARIDHAYRLLLARAPSEEEIDLLQAYMGEERARFASTPGEATHLLADIHRDIPRPEGVPPVELAVWLQVARTLLNLDEVIHRG